jgi:hypothetical protein
MKRLNSSPRFKCHSKKYSQPFEENDIGEELATVEGRQPIGKVLFVVANRIQDIDVRIGSLGKSFEGELMLHVCICSSD